MKIIIAALATTLALAVPASAGVWMTSCSIVHTNNGNVFTIGYHGVPDNANGNICGESDKEMDSLANKRGITKRSNNCHTDGWGGMLLEIKLDKQSCQFQNALIVDAVSKGLDGRADFNPTTACSFSNC
jgi:hypothetical protein